MSDDRIDYLASRMEILDCINRIARGVDRLDEAIFRSGYHPDAVLDFGTMIGDPQRFIDFFFELHRTMHKATAHTICNHVCEIDGDVAHAESYVIGLFADKGGQTSRILAGRYIDRLEKRDGEWRIALRRATVEVALEGKAILPNGQTPPGSGYLMGDRGPADPSYQRPLTAEGGRRW